MFHTTPCLSNFVVPDKIPRANGELNKILFVGIKDASKARGTERLSDTGKKINSPCCGWLQHWGRGAAGRGLNSVTPYRPAKGNV